MGCCIVTNSETEFLMCDSNKDDREAIEHIGKNSTGEFLILNSSSSIIMFEYNPLDDPTMLSLHDCDKELV